MTAPMIMPAAAPLLKPHSPALPSVTAHARPMLSTRDTAAGTALNHAHCLTLTSSPTPLFRIMSVEPCYCPRRLSQPSQASILHVWADAGSAISLALSVQPEGGGLGICIVLLYAVKLVPDQVS